ncbi:hypothetical protein JCM18897A_37750 [Streptomyces sp. JCM 18897]
MAAMGSKYIVEALIARHNSRMIAVEKLPAASIEPVMSALLSIGYTDVAFRQLGVSRDRSPSSYGANWIDHLAWGGRQRLRGSPPSFLRTIHGCYRDSKISI